MGFTQPAGHPAAGKLLPHHFTLTRLGGFLLVGPANKQLAGLKDGAALF